MNYLKDKFSHNENVIKSIRLLELNNFKIDLGFGGEIENVIDLDKDHIVTGDSIFSYPKEIMDALIILNDLE